MPTVRIERRLAAILAADVVGYSRLIEANEAKTLAAMRTLRSTVIDPLVAEHGGRFVKLMGDGALVEFGSVVDAVACAMAVQKDVGPHQAGALPEERIVFRIGINLGDVVVEGDDLLGDGVNIAARLEALAEPGGICISDTVQRQLAGKTGAIFEDAGERSLKNIERPVRVWRWAKDPAMAHAAPSLSLPDKPSIAVLPFTNMSGDPEQEYFSDGITEDIITDLSKISALSVIARNSSFTYKGKSIDVQEVSKRFNVATILEGSVRKSGQRVRITAQLVNGRDGTHLWAVRYDRDLTDIFAIQDEITKTIVDQLKVKLLPGEARAIMNAPTGNLEAYDYYLKGRQLFHKSSRSHLVLARRMFAKAIEIDPSYARAHAGMADCDCYLFFMHDLDVPLDDVLLRIEKALELYPDLAEAHASKGLALAYLNRNSEAVVAFERAIDLDPNLFEGVYYYGRFRCMQRDFRQAIELLERASRLQPTDCRPTGFLTEAFSALGDQVQREKWAKSTLERAEAELSSNPENPVAVTFGAGALVQLGERERALRWAERALTIAPDDVTTRYNIACTYSLLGEADRAFDLLEPLAENVIANLPKHRRGALDWLQKDTMLDPIRGYPRYQKLLARIEAAP